MQKSSDTHANDEIYQTSTKPETAKQILILLELTFTISGGFLKVVFSIGEM
jgi:hypothetical protein